MATKKELEAQIAAMQADADDSPAPKGRKVKMPPWIACSDSQVIGVDTLGRNGFVTIARRDGESDSPIISVKANSGKGGPAKAKRLDPATVRFILDNEEHVRKLADAADKLTR